MELTTVREASLSAWPSLAVRAVVAVFVLALLATSVGGDATPALAGDLTGRISTARSGQSYFESLMRQQDRVMSSIQRKGDKARRKVKRASRTIKRTHKRYVAAARVVRARSALLAEAEARFPDPNEAPDPENWKAKMLRLRRDVEKALEHRHDLGRTLRKSNRNRSARLRQLGQLKRERKGVIRRQNYAEAALASQIVRMTSLAQQRAASQTGVRLAADETFAWPSEGRILAAVRLHRVPPESPAWFVPPLPRRHRPRGWLRQRSSRRRGGRRRVRGLEPMG